LFHYFNDSVKVFLVISLDPEFAVVSQPVPSRFKEFGVNHSPGMMPPFRPGIRKVEMKTEDRFFGDQKPDYMVNLHPEHPKIPETAVKRFPARLSYSPQEPFDAEKIPLWKRFGGFQQKFAGTRSEIHFDWQIVSEDLTELKWFHDTRRKDLQFRIGRFLLARCCHFSYPHH
jgi:hypothetical protein